jgi:hypothetical protein
MKEIQDAVAHALTITDIRQQYEYVYDAICDYMDKEFREKNHCDFCEDNMCFVNREKLGVNPNMGCCYSFRADMFMDIRDKKLCQYMNPEQKKCDIKCVSCKLYACQHLNQKGVEYDIREFPYIRKIFDRNQIEVLRFNFFKTREEIINKLLEVKDSKLPFCMFYLFGAARA